jgi:hypothetical protein
MVSIQGKGGTSSIALLSEPITAEISKGELREAKRGKNVERNN